MRPTPYSHYTQRQEREGDVTEIDLMRSMDWYQMCIMVALIIQFALFATFAVASLYSYINDQLGSAIFMALLASLLRPLPR